VDRLADEPALGAYPHLPAARERALLQKRAAALQQDRVAVARPAACDGAVLDVVTFQVRERIVVGRTGVHVEKAMGRSMSG
jgi:hypothetical protein